MWRWWTLPDASALYPHDSRPLKALIGAPSGKEVWFTVRRWVSSFSKGSRYFGTYPRGRPDSGNPEPSTILPAMDAFFLGKISIASLPTRGDLVRIKNTM